ncbi:MAG: hypothetical protein K9K66_18435 [Desulfarculaceae bacterium]|nr:hypothetical protein [Desulfarculaceae bacterium]MCF8074386.1 hypothetical protein [Desulfarculaceae bacterium]MCF8103638.1 hypothetical protein [Desulfarculaceae bacterium]MCF8116051.1 hypothetical protein [Desulfarculaceae bacterium]
MRIFPQMAWFLAAIALALALQGLAPARVCRAAEITPTLKFTFGWSDNVRLIQVPRADFFVKAGPGISAYWKWPGHQLRLSGAVLYAQYFTLSDLDGFDNASLGLNYTYDPSPRWQFFVRDTFTSNFDAAQLNDEGEFVTTRNNTGRQDRNSLMVGARYKYGPSDYFLATLTDNFTIGDNEGQNNALYNRLDLTWNSRITQDYELTLGASGVRTDYQTTPDEDRGRGFVRLTRLVGPTQQIWGETAYTINRAVTETDEVGSGRNYQIASINLGYSHQVSPKWDYLISAGWSYVQGDQQSNSAANQGFPIFNLSTTYRGQRWFLRAYATADLGQFDYLGDNSGLTVSHRAGLSWQYKFSRRQDINLNLEYARNDYQENALLDDTDNQGTVDSYRFIATYNWQIYRHWRITLEYYYLNRDAEIDNDDRQENRLMLILNTDYPFRW